MIKAVAQLSCFKQKRLSLKSYVMLLQAFLKCTRSIQLC